MQINRAPTAEKMGRVVCFGIELDDSDRWRPPAGTTEPEAPARTKAGPDMQILGSQSLIAIQFKGGICKIKGFVCT
jgi:hypothetical protein